MSNKIKRPTHLEQVGKMDEIMEFLLEHCDPSDKTAFQKTRRVSARLNSLIALFEKGDRGEGIDVSVHGFVHRMAAKKKGYFEHRPDKKENNSKFSKNAKSIIDWLSDVSGDNLPSQELQDEAMKSFDDPLTLASTKKALNEIFENIEGQVVVKENALCEIRAKLVEKTCETIPQESRAAVETALKSSRPFDNEAVSEGLRQDGGNVYIQHPNGVVGMNAKAMLHMLLRIKGPKDNHTDNSCNDCR